MKSKDLEGDTWPERNEWMLQVSHVTINECMLKGTFDFK
jgi:hypothetical protein